MVFCNLNKLKNILSLITGHNPYFNRWFSAIGIFDVLIAHLPLCHNPYFNRWFSAILRAEQLNKLECKVTILILIDGFLQ